MRIWSGAVALALGAIPVGGLAGDAGEAGLVVHTASGAVAGRVEEGLRVWRGIPFAAPPVGDLRWRAPQAVAPWQGTRDATRFAAPCMQSGPAANPLPPAEDCLYLNIWAPPAAARKAPVLVWIHGGAFRAGTAADPRVAGDQLARRGIVVVSIQYRLGALGFLSHPALSAEAADHVSGNYGLLDQIAALRWVRANIARFGGDPARVTLGGQSAGAISAAMLAAAPQARGLFRAIFSMSGGSFAPPRSPAEGGENMEPLAQSEQHGLAFAQRLGAVDVAALRRLPAAQVQAANAEGVGWPVIDGKTIPGDEYRMLQAGRIARVPLLLGSTADEGYNFSRITTLDQYRTEVRRRYGSFAEQVLAAYPAHNDAQAVRQARDLLRDVMFGWGTWAWASLASAKGKVPVHLYYFEHTPPPGPGMGPNAGAIHGADVPYPFGISHQARDWGDVDRSISQAMMGYVVRFVQTGDPNASGLPHWPRFGGASPQVMRFSRKVGAGPVANEATLRLIDRYMAARRAQGDLLAPK